MAHDHSHHQHDNHAADLEPVTLVADEGGWARKLSITIPAEQVNKVFDRVALDLGKQVKIPGFRPGKVPLRMIEKKYGEEVSRHVKADIVDAAFRKSLEAEKLDVIGSPEVETEDVEVARGKEMTFDVQVEVKPTFELGTYKELPVEQEEVEVFPEEIDAAIKQMAEKHSTLETAPDGEKIGNKDIGAGPLVYLVDGESVLEEKDAQLMLMDGKVLGAHADLEGATLEGAKVGDSLSFDTELGKHFPDEARRGQKATLTFEVKSVRRTQLPELNDEFAVKMKLKDMAELRSKIEEQMRGDLATRNEKSARQDLVDRVINNSPFDLPPRLVKMYSKQMEQSRKQMFAQYGMADLEAEQMKALFSGIEQDAEKELRTFFVLEAICKKEDIEATDEEVDDEVIQQARSQGKRAQEVFEKLEQEGGLDQIKQNLNQKKAEALLFDQAEVTVVPRKKDDPKKDADAAAEGGNAEGENKEDEKAEVKDAGEGQSE